MISDKSFSCSTFIDWFNKVSKTQVFILDNFYLSIKNCS